MPEQDLLKSLHHFAASYYSDKGQLIDASRIARQRKRENGHNETGSRPTSLSTVDSIPGEESDYNETDVAPTSSVMLQTQEKKGKQGADLVKDMYKMFDGSALVALGKYLLINAVPAADCSV